MKTLFRILRKPFKSSDSFLTLLKMMKTSLNKKNLKKKFMKKVTNPLRKTNSHLMNPLKKKMTLKKHIILNIKAMMMA
jgi:hypothetical protein